jgi:acyl-CoA synthetase (AMP-forming)/AMP-acid ligase II
MIIRGRREHLPEKIETALYGHDGVLEAAVVGRPDRVLGEVVIAYVALRPGADVTIDELHALCADRVATPFVGGAAPASPIVGVN